MSNLKTPSYIKGGLASMFQNAKTNQIESDEDSPDPEAITKMITKKKKKLKRKLPKTANDNGLEVKSSKLVEESAEIKFTAPTNINNNECKKEKKNKKIKKPKKMMNMTDSFDHFDENEILEDDDDNEKIPPKQKNSEKHKEKIEDDPEKQSRTLFVGNLPISIKQKDLKTLFKGYGKVESVRLRSAVPSKPNLPKKIAIVTKNYHPNKQSINGYVVMENKSEAESAMVALNGLFLEKNHIRVDLATKKEFDMKRSIFVGNLSFAITDEELYQCFEECGNVEAVRVVRDTATGIGKGFGYVLFYSIDSLMLALQKNETELNGRILRVFRCKKTKKNNKEGQGAGFQSEIATSRPMSNSQTNALKRINNKKQKMLFQANKTAKPSSFEGVRSTGSRKERQKVEMKIKAYQRNVKGRKEKREMKK